MSKLKRWTEAEDSRLFRQVKAFPQNLNKCFIIVGEELGRSTGAVASRWYTHVSKDPRYIGFVQLGWKYKLCNRKNGNGTISTSSVFKRVLQLLGL